MTADTISLLLELLSQVTISAALPPEVLEEQARRLATARRELEALTPTP